MTPFKSRWPLDDPDMDYFESDEIKPSSIKRSIMGLIGDFGKYSMGRIHDWSTSPIGSKPSTKLDLLNEFIKKINADAQTIIVNYIEYKTEHEKLEKLSNNELEEIVTLDIETWTKKAKEHEVEDVDTWLEKHKDGKSNDPIQEKFSFNWLKEKLKKKISKNLLEELRWIHGIRSLDGVASYSRKKAQRWVCKRAFDLGWSNELFKKYEQQHCISNPNRSTSKIERIGKKYQRIAYHEFLAHLSDNCSYIDPGYDDIDYSKFHGAWQLHGRNIDPTMLIRKTKDTDWQEDKKSCWWLNYEHQFTGDNLDEKNLWLWDTDNIPSFENIVSFNNPTNDSQFYMLRGFSKWRKDSNKKELPYQELWFRVNSCIIKNEDFDQLNNVIGRYNLRSPDILNPDSSGHQCFFREFPWHQSYKDHKDWEDQLSFKIKENLNHFIPTSIYEWESGSNDFSIDDSISIYTPSKSIVNLLGLKHDPINLGYWLNKNRDLVFLDPSVSEHGPSVGLIDQKSILDILKQNNYKLVWFIGGEKQMFSNNSNKFHGRLIFNSILSLSEEGIEETKWYERSFPNN
jgi:hypothetical protein